MLSTIIVFYGIEITFWGSWDTDMFITCIISPTTIDRSVTEQNYAKKAVSQKTSLMTGQLFSWLSSFFHRFYPIKVKWRPGLNNYNFQCALGNIRSHCKPKNDTKVYL